MEASDPGQPDETVVQQIARKLEGLKIEFSMREHEPVFTSEQAAEVRGTTLASGAKALVCKANDRFVMLVLPADRKLHSKSARRALQVKSLRFATREEVEELTGLKPGSIPPFGSLFELETHCDEALLQQPEINFNAGSHRVSCTLALQDYLRVEQPVVLQMSEGGDGENSA